MRVASVGWLLKSPSGLWGPHQSLLVEKTSPLPLDILEVEASLVNTGGYSIYWSFDRDIALRMGSDVRVLFVGKSPICSKLGL